MTSRSEIKRMALACGNLNWRFQQENWTEFAIRDDHGYIATMRVGSPKQPGPDTDREAKARFVGEMTPSAVLELISEFDALAEAYVRAGEREHTLRLERATLREAVKYAAETFKKISSSDGSGHADLASAVLRLAGDAMGEVAP